MKSFLLLVLAFTALSSATIYFQDDFSDEDWQSRWVISESKPAEERGELGLSAGKYFGDEKAERGLQTKEDARFYHLSQTFPEFSNKDSKLVIQYSIKQDNDIDCGGSYIKLHPKGLDQVNYNGDSEYNIMFGPDVCGTTRRVHAILTKNGENHLITNDIPLAERDHFTHVYTFILDSDNTFKVLVDGEERRSGEIDEHWTILEPRQIPDPNEEKPADWVDEAYIDDPEDIKPEGWDDIPREIPDPEAAKPDDWDDELDGEWEAPTVPNPEYKGEWSPKKIENPDYKGPWVHPLIDNPAYVPDPTLYTFDSFGAIGIEVWQVKSGTIFGNFLVTDSEETAAEAREAVLARVDGEKKAKDEADVAEALKAEAAAKAAGDDDEFDYDVEPEAEPERDEL